MRTYILGLILVDLTLEYFNNFSIKILQEKSQGFIDYKNYDYDDEIITLENKIYYYPSLENPIQMNVKLNSFSSAAAIDNKTILFSCTNDSLLEIWDKKTNKTEILLNYGNIEGKEINKSIKYECALSFHKNNNLIALGVSFYNSIETKKYNCSKNYYSYYKSINHHYIIISRLNETKLSENSTDIYEFTSYHVSDYKRPILCEIFKEGSQIICLYQEYYCTKGYNYQYYEICAIQILINSKGFSKGLISCFDNEYMIFHNVKRISEDLLIFVHRDKFYEISVSSSQIYYARTNKVSSSSPLYKSYFNGIFTDYENGIVKIYKYDNLYKYYGIQLGGITINKIKGSLYIQENNKKEIYIIFQAGNKIQYFLIEDYLFNATCGKKTYEITSTHIFKNEPLRLINENGYENLDFLKYIIIRGGNCTTKNDCFSYNKNEGTFNKNISDYDWIFFYFRYQNTYLYNSNNYTIYFFFDSSEVNGTCYIYIKTCKEPCSYCSLNYSLCDPDSCYKDYASFLNNRSLCIPNNYFIYGHVYDKEVDKIHYLECWPTCSFCYKPINSSNSTNHNCYACKDIDSSLQSYQYTGNCYKYNNYNEMKVVNYPDDENFTTTENDTCPENYSYYSVNSKECLKDCVSYSNSYYYRTYSYYESIENIKRYLYYTLNTPMYKLNDKCYTSCPSNTSSSNYICECSKYYDIENKTGFYNCYSTYYCSTEAKRYSIGNLCIPDDCPETYYKFGYECYKDDCPIKTVPIMNISNVTICDSFTYNYIIDRNKYLIYSKDRDYKFKMINTSQYFYDCNDTKKYHYLRPQTYMFNWECHFECPNLTLSNTTNPDNFSCYCENYFHYNITDEKYYCYEEDIDYCFNESYLYLVNYKKQCFLNDCPSGFYKFQFECYNSSQGCPNNTNYIKTLNSRKICESPIFKYYVNEITHQIIYFVNDSEHIYQLNGTNQYLRKCEDSLKYNYKLISSYLFNDVCYFDCPKYSTNKIINNEYLCICDYFYEIEYKNDYYTCYVTNYCSNPEKKYSITKECIPDNCPDNFYKLGFECYRNNCPSNYFEIGNIGNVTICDSNSTNYYIDKIKYLHYEFSDFNPYYKYKMVNSTQYFSRCYDTKEYYYLFVQTYEFNWECYFKCPNNTLPNITDNTNYSCYCIYYFHIEKNKNNLDIYICYNKTYNYCYYEDFYYLKKENNECISNNCPINYYKFQFECYKDGCPSGTINIGKREGVNICESESKKYYVDKITHKIIFFKNNSEYIYQLNGTNQYLSNCEDTLTYNYNFNKSYLFNNKCYFECPLSTIENSTYNSCICSNYYDIDTDSGYYDCYDTNYCSKEGKRYSINDTKECISNDCPKNYYKFGFECYTEECPSETQPIKVINGVIICESISLSYYINKTFYFAEFNNNSIYTLKIYNSNQYLESCYDSKEFHYSFLQSYLFNNECYFSCPNNTLPDITDPLNYVCKCKLNYHIYENYHICYSYDYCYNESYLYLDINKNECIQNDCRNNSFKFQFECYEKGCPEKTIQLKTLENGIKICESNNNDYYVNKITHKNIFFNKNSNSTYKYKLEGTNQYFEKCEDTKLYNYNFLYSYLFNGICYFECPISLYTIPSPETNNFTCICQFKYSYNDPKNGIICSKDDYSCPLPELVFLDKTNECITKSDCYLKKNEEYYIIPEMNKCIHKDDIPEGFYLDLNVNTILSNSYKNKTLETCIDYNSKQKVLKTEKKIVFNDICYDEIKFEEGLNEVTKVENTVINKYQLGKNSNKSLDGNNEISYIDFGECAELLINQTGNNNLYVISGETIGIEKKSGINKLTFKIFYENGTELTDYSVCDNVKTKAVMTMQNFEEINYDSAAYLLNQGINIYDKKSEFYNQKCFPAELNGNNIILSDRRNDIYPNGVTLCPDGCELGNADIIKKKFECDCPATFCLQSGNNNSYTENKSLSYTENLSFLESLKTKINIDVFGCNNLLEVKKIFPNNIAFYISLGVFSITFLFFLSFYCCEINYLRDAFMENTPTKKSLEKLSREQEELRQKELERNNKSSNTELNKTKHNENKLYPPKKKDNKNKKIGDSGIKDKIQDRNIKDKIINEKEINLNEDINKECKINKYEIDFKNNIKNSGDDINVVNEINFNEVDDINTKKKRFKKGKKSELNKNNIIDSSKKEKDDISSNQANLINSRKKKKKIRHNSPKKMERNVAKNKNERKNKNEERELSQKMDYENKEKEKYNQRDKLVCDKKEQSKKTKSKKIFSFDFNFSHLIIRNDKIQKEDYFSLPYSQAKRIDKRGVFSLFFYYMLRKIEIIKILFLRDEYTFIPVLLSTYLLSTYFNLFFNSLLYSDDVVQEKYQNKGELNKFSIVLLSVLSNILTSLLSVFIAFLTNYDTCVRILLKTIKVQNNYIKKYECLLPRIKIKMSIYFIFQFLSICGISYYMIIFCTLYSASQKSLFTNFLIGEVEGLTIKIISSIIVSIFRRIGLTCHCEKIYNFSKYVDSKF